MRGRVVDAETGGPLPQVNVTLERAGVVMAGTATDDDGQYTIEAVAGTYQLFARFVGYQTAQTEVVVAGAPVVVDLPMEAAVLDLDEVEVQAEPFQEKDDARISVTRLRPQEARRLAGGSEDVMRTLQTLPGVFATSDYSNQLVVRGGTPDQNLIILDEIEVFSPYQLNGMGSLINPALIR